MAARHTLLSLPSTSEAIDLGTDESLSTPYDDGSLPTAIDRHLSHRRESAANFKRLSKGESDDYCRVIIAEQELTSKDKVITSKLRRAIELREKWLYRREVPEWYNYAEPRHCNYTVFVPPPYHPFEQPMPSSSHHVCQWKDGVVNVFSDRTGVMRRRPEFTSSTLQEYANDLTELMSVVNDPECRSFCFRRLELLQERFNMYITLNDEEERLSQIRVPHRDFYNVRKVDVHVHHSSLANQKHFLRFIKRKVRDCGDEKVWQDKKNPDSPPLSLKEVFQSINLQPHELSVDTLNVHADSTTFHRFDRFNLKYNPFGQSRLREIFMKTDNFIKGKYLAELTKEVCSELQDTKYQNSEYRISIYGRDPLEWEKLGEWFVDNKIYSDNVRWLIQIPRLYNTYKERKTVTSFQDMLDNIFNPLFEATVDPNAHLKVALTLQQVVGFDSVDDESLPQVRTNLARCGPPDKWDCPDNPPYSYYAFYLYSNLSVLNKLRESKGLNTFTYRPHAGEAGDIEHLGTSFLLANAINHGLLLKKSPVLQYLFYLTQIGVAMSPLSNNALFCEYTKNPLPVYFRRGLNVTLSTDDPLQFALTREPLVEEYSVAAQVWKLSGTDLCELARNSVLQSGFEPCIKARWLGKSWYEAGQAGNDISRTNVPSIRLCYRYETLLDELSLIYDGDVPKTIEVLPTYEYNGLSEVDGSSVSGNGDARGGNGHASKKQSTPKNRLKTAIAATILGTAVFLFPMVASKFSPRPVIDSSQPLKPEAARRGAFNNSGSRDIGPDPDWVDGRWRPNRTKKNKPTSSSKSGSDPSK